MVSRALPPALLPLPVATPLSLWPYTRIGLRIEDRRLRIEDWNLTKQMTSISADSAVRVRVRVPV